MRREGDEVDGRSMVKRGSNEGDRWSIEAQRGRRGRRTDPFAEANAEDSGAGSKEYVHVRIQQRNGRKSLTTVQGLKKEFSYNKILKDLKRSFAAMVPLSRIQSWARLSNFKVISERMSRPFLFRLFYFSDIPVSTGYDGVCFPSKFFPNFLVDLNLWFTSEYGDYLLIEKPSFFVGLMWLELLFQWPLAIANLYAILVGGKLWFNSTCLVYEVSVFTGMLQLSMHKCFPSQFFPNFLVDLNLRFTSEYGDYLLIEKPSFFVGLSGSSFSSSGHLPWQIFMLFFWEGSSGSVLPAWSMESLFLVECGADIVFKNHECIDDDVLTFPGFCSLNYSMLLVTMLSPN
ncbi:hypothetical protein TEA_007857 [Camellia sinensis var. sinensis]|uniref:SUI1 domain-containing protein n=1 Tax=Camellia sinensis var. sinensis TaxID=542762 RepID=A0A4S4F036_CAMSN|nr:hypothetical protein TEA_007857 [Camellia sinensis var. sinensis]